MAVSFNNRYLALFTDTGLLWIGSSDLQKVYCEFDTKCPTRPQQLVWYVSSLYGISINVVLIIVMGCNFPSKRIQCQKPRPVVLCLLIYNFILTFFNRCGTGAIVGYWENILLMVGPQKDWVKYPCNEKLTNIIVFRLM